MVDVIDVRTWSAVAGDAVIIGLLIEALDGSAGRVGDTYWKAFLEVAVFLTHNNEPVHHVGAGVVYEKDYVFGALWNLLPRELWRVTDSAVAYPLYPARGPLRDQPHVTERC